MRTCHKCKQEIEEGEVAVPRRLNGSPNRVFFHDRCFAPWVAENAHVERTADTARIIH